MNESVFARIPRFDESHTVQDESSAATVETAPTVQSLPEPAPPSLDPNVELLLQQLAQEIAGIDQRVASQTINWVRTISERLFPELSKAFLAEELCRQLPALLPKSASEVVISAPETLAGQLSEKLSLSGGKRITITPVAKGAETEVSWGQGGLAFEHEALLQACLARLQSLQTQIEVSE